MGISGVLFRTIIYDASLHITQSDSRVTRGGLLLFHTSTRPYQLKMPLSLTTISMPYLSPGNLILSGLYFRNGEKVWRAIPNQDPDYRL